MPNPFSGIITSDMKTIFNNAIDALLEDSACMVPCTVYYGDTNNTDCPNCLFNVVTGRSSGLWTFIGYRVTGNGDGDDGSPNGIYEDAGELNGQRYYVRQDGAFVLWWRSGAAEWYIAVASDDFDSGFWWVAGVGNIESTYAPVTYTGNPIVTITGGPIEFHGGTCPYCHGRGVIPNIQTETIYLMPIWDYRDWVNWSGTVEGSRYPEGFVQTMSKMADTITQIKKAKEIIIDTDIEAYVHHRFTRYGEPNPCGFGDDRYIFTIWKRIG